MFGEEELVKLHKDRAEQIGNIIIICFALVLARLWYLQVYRGKLLYNYSLENRLRKEIVRAPRGMLFDRNNELLVHNSPRFDAIITPQYLKKREDTISRLATVLDMQPEGITKILQKNAGQASYRPVTIKKNISRKEVAIIETDSGRLPGISVRAEISREYTDNDTGAHLLGYISEISQTQLPKLRKRDNIDYKLGDYIGQAGVEEEYDLSLRGIDGHEFMEVDARGRMKKHLNSDDIFRGIENQMALPGKNIRLTIDRDLQLAAYKALDGKAGSAVAIDVNTGEVLAMVSRPAFTPAEFSKGVTSDYWESLVNDEKRPLRDRTVQEHYSPGSTFKTITAIAALESGVIDENSEVSCKGSFRLGSRTFHCWKKEGHGTVEIHRAIRESCDVFFYKIATKLDIDVLAKYSKLLGMGSRSGIELPRETTGLIPTKEWKKKRNGQDWQVGETLSCVIGQSYVLTTPLQLTLAYGAIASGGKIYKPHVVKEIFGNDGEIIKSFKPELLSDVKFSPKTLKLVREGLFEVVNSPRGTAYWQRGEGIHMAGKTGTSQVIQFSADKIFKKCENNEYRFRHHGLFAAYAPADSPKIAVAVVVEHGCHGSSAAGPVAREVITTFMKKYYPEEHKAYIEADKKAGRTPPKVPVKIDEDEDAPIHPSEG